MRLYRSLLLLLPASFRAVYADEMCAVLARRRREVAGPGPVLALWGRELLGLLATALSAHADLLRQDLAYTVRAARRSPGFVVMVVLMAGLGIGATTAAFSTADHVLFRPLPFPDSERLVKLYQDQSFRGYARMELSPANYRDWKRQSTSFESMASYRGLSVNLVGEGYPQRLEGASVNADLFPMLGRRPLLGRLLTADDDREGAPGAVLLSHGLWKAMFDGDPLIIGRKLIFDQASYVVVGVMPPGFHFPNRQAQLWTAMRFVPDDYSDRANNFLHVLAKLRPGVSLAQARAELGTIAGHLARAFPVENERTGATVVQLRDEVGRQFRLLLLALVGAAVGLLLIACTNLASLLVARALVRRRELAVRTALGAGRERLLRQLLTESLVLSAAGGLLGVLIAMAATPLLVRLVPNGLPIAAAPGLDLRLLGFALALTLATGLGFGALPALRAARAVDLSALREGRSGGSARRERLRSVLVTVQVTLSVALLICTGLLLRALWQVQSQDPGFRSQGVLTLRTSLPMPRYEQTARRSQFFRQVLAEAAALPGVTGAAYVSFLPMVVRGGIWPVTVPGSADAPGASAASLRFVTPGFFATLNIPLLRGRDVSDRDSADSAPVAVVSQSFARRYWPGQDAIGRRFSMAFAERTVVGVVGDIKVRGLERISEPQVYLAHQQVPDGGLVWYAPKDLVIRTEGSPHALLPALRRIVAAADPQQPISDVMTLAEIVAADTGARTAQVNLLSAFAALAVLLAAFGIHGLLAFAVSSRTQEIGVRMALGAERRHVLHLVLGQGLLLAGLGVILGMLLATAAGRALQTLLAGVSPWDLPTFAVAAAVSLAMTLVGSLTPALRAVRVDPLIAIRAE